jgi:hypothetical protein
MMMRLFLLIIASLAASRCATLQPPSEMAAEQEVLADNLPKKPFPNQWRPGPDGTCGDPRIIAINGGCWGRVRVSLEACQEAEGEIYLFVYHGACYTPMWEFTGREPTSSR